MKRLAYLLFCLSLAAPLGAKDSRLESLQTGEDSKGWEAVGRLDLNGVGFCTGALIEPNLVLTAAHCLFDRRNGERIAPDKIEFRAGWRNGRALAYRDVRRAVIHPDYTFSETVISDKVRNDVALLELQSPIRNTTVHPFKTDFNLTRGKQIGIVSYAHDRSEAPSLQEICTVMGRQGGVLVTTCNVDFGSSGAPIFSFENGNAKIVSVVSAKAELNGTKVSLGTSLEEPLDILRQELASGKGFMLPPSPGTNRITIGERGSGAKFIKP